MRRALLLTLLLFAVPATAQAQAPTQERRDAAIDALEQVEDLAAGDGVKTGRELSPALLELAKARPDLSAADRRRADEILARPTDPDDDGPFELGPYTAPSQSTCSAHFCVHWVETSNDAPIGADNNFATIPAYVETMKATFEQAYDAENGTLGWRLAVPDGTEGGDDKVDVYIQDVGDARLFGYASTDPGQSGRSRYAYLVMDDDYAEFGYPTYLPPLQVTAAHEYNHVLQYAYDSLQDDWMFESTATWMEDKVFDGVNDYVSYMPTWAARPFEPITSSVSDKVYGSAIWNHWLDGIYGPDVVRDAWAGSQATGTLSRGFAPGAYDAAIRAKGGPGFSVELGVFSAASAEWDAANSGIREGSSFPAEVGPRGTLTPGGTTVSGTVDHTAFALYTVPVPAGTGQVNLTGGLSPGTRGAIALVGYDGTNQDRAVGQLDADGVVTVSLGDPARFSRITAVVVNTDTSNTGRGSDWLWTRNGQFFSLTATTGAVPVEPTPVPTASPTPTPTPTPRTSIGLTRSSTRLATIVRKGVLSFFARTNKAGRLTARATVDRATAVRLKVGRRTTSAGTAVRTFRSPARLKINVTLTRKVRAALKRHRGKAVTVKVAVSFTPSDGTGTVRRTFTLRLRR